MRDILLSLVIAGLLPVALVRPVVGAYLWAWLSIMNPHQLAYGFARGMPWAMMAAVVTVIGFVATRDKKTLPMTGGTVLLLLLMVWMTVTSFYALNTPSEVWERWVFGMKIFLMLLLTMMLLRGRRQIDILIAVLVFSIGFYGVKGGIWTILTGGGSRVWGPPGGMLQGNNELAVALVTQMPWMYYLMVTASKRWLKHLLVASMVFCAFAILGTQSRGALLALLTMTWFLGIKGKYPVRTTLMLAALVAVAIAFMPSTWSDRMETLQDYKNDGSAMSRIYTWTTLWNAAVDRPLVGAGFRADATIVFDRYAPHDTQDVFWRGSVFVAHSIYFQALGEHGFVGLALYLGLGLWAWWKCGRLAKTTQDDPEFRDWVPVLMRMCQASLIGFAVGGAFLSLMLLDLPYYIIGIVILTGATVRDARARAAPVGAEVRA